MTPALPTSYRVLGAVPLGEGVADKPTKRKEPALLAGRFVERLGLGARGRLSPLISSKSKITILLILLSGLKVK